MTTVTINGNTYTDDADPDTGWYNYGHVPRFNRALTDITVVLAEVVADAATVAIDAAAADAAATAAAASATAAAATVSSYLSIPAYSGTSVTSLTLGTGTKTLTASTGKDWVPGMLLRLFNAAGIYMVGTCTAYDSGTGAMTFESESYVGSGTYASWTISVAPAPDRSLFWSTFFRKY